MHLRYNYASPSHLITRLTSRNLHLLALRITGFLGLKPDPVLKHWACAKILKSRPAGTEAGNGTELNGDDDVCRLIVEKFEDLGGADVSYAEIAKKAWEVGRGGLATKVWCLNLSSEQPLIREISFWTMNRKGQIKFHCYWP